MADALGIAANNYLRSNIVDFSDIPTMIQNETGLKTGMIYPELRNHPLDFDMLPGNNLRQINDTEKIWQYDNNDSAWYDALINDRTIHDEILPYFQKQEIESLALAANMKENGRKSEYAPDFAFIGGTAARLYLLSGLVKKHRMTYKQARQYLRDTHDVDLVYFNDSRIKELLEEGGYSIRKTNNKYLASKNSGGEDTGVDAFNSSEAIGSSKLKIDYEEINRVKDIEIGGISCPVASVEDVIATKLRVVSPEDSYKPRPKDLSDAANLIAMYGPAEELDLVYLKDRTDSKDRTKFYSMIEYLKKQVISGAIDSDLIYSRKYTLDSINNIESRLYRKDAGKLGYNAANNGRKTGFAS